MAEVDEKLKVYKGIQDEIRILYGQKTQSLSQYNENTLVKGELDLLDEDTPVYKLVGPALMTVELPDAKQNVSKRLNFIEAEIKKLDDAITKKQGEAAELGDIISNMQTQMQRDAQLAANAISNSSA